MSKNYLLFIFIIFSFFFISENVYAECSYNTRKQLLEEAKKVNVSYEVETIKKEEKGINSATGEEDTYKYNEYKFNFIITNLSKNIFIKYYNDYNLEVNYITSENLLNGIYKFTDDNTSQIIQYYFDIYSSNDECIGEEITTKKILKPKYNSFYSYDVCDNKALINYKYCKQFIDEEFNITTGEFMNKVNEYLKTINNNNNSSKKTNNETSFLQLVKNYWYFLFIFILIIIILFILIVLKKRRNEL